MKNIINLSKKKALVTGGRRGIGYEIVKSLYLCGCDIVIFDLIEPKNFIDDFDSERVKYIQCDMSSSKDVEASYAQAIKFLGWIDILVNNAGINKRFQAEKFPMDDWENIINVNLNSVFNLCKIAGNDMLKRKSGKIINIASMLSFTGGYTASAYSASKGGIAQLTKSLTNEWASKNINVNAIAPGFIHTKLNVEIMDNKKRYNSILNRIPAKRWGEPEDISGIVIFLASDLSDYINGAIIPVDGGYLAR